MKQINGEKSVIAWFKLADLIERGEKERALGVLRLLTHSFEDKALARQLQADVLHTFNDELAFECYRDAISLYHTSDRPQQALMLFEMIYQHHQPSCSDIIEMIVLSHKLMMSFKLITLYTRLIGMPHIDLYMTQITTLAAESMSMLNNNEQQVLNELLAVRR